jgi:predicted site-specific integrase-resolvase
MTTAQAEEYLHRPRVNTLKAAEIAGVTERTIYNWMRFGRVDFVRTPTGGVRIYADSLLKREPDTD